MLTLEDKIYRATSNYNDSNFFSANDIGILSRGPSLYRLDLCYKKFNHCYLAGEFYNTLNFVEKYLLDKDIVLSIMQHERYRTSEYYCRKLGIKNVQVALQEGTEHYKKCVEKFRDLRVVGYNKRHSELMKNIKGEMDIHSTGILAIFFAIYFNPKNIYIIGVDFYNRNVKPYFRREEHDLPKKKGNEVSSFRAKMISNLSSICRVCPDINFHLYTTFRGIKSNNNLNVIYV